jgi:hypothetical protein
MILQFDPLRREEAEDSHHHQNEREKSEQEVERQLGRPSEKVIRNHLVPDIAQELPRR